MWVFIIPCVHVMTIQYTILCETCFICDQDLAEKVCISHSLLWQPLGEHSSVLRIWLESLNGLCMAWFQQLLVQHPSCHRPRRNVMRSQLHGSSMRWLLNDSVCLIWVHTACLSWMVIKRDEYPSIHQLLLWIHLSIKVCNSWIVMLWFSIHQWHTS